MRPKVVYRQPSSLFLMKSVHVKFLLLLSVRQNLSSFLDMSPCKRALSRFLNQLAEHFCGALFNEVIWLVWNRSNIRVCISALPYSLS